MAYLQLCDWLLRNAREEGSEQALMNACLSLQMYSQSVDTSSSESQLVYASQNYHAFIKSMLDETWVIGSSKLLNCLYETFYTLLAPLTPLDLQCKVYTPAFIRFFVASYVRDVTRFEDDSSDIVTAAYVYIEKMNNKDPLEVLKDCNFHTAVIEQFSRAKTRSNVCSTLDLLSLLIERYSHYIQEIKDFVEAKVPFLLLEKASIIKPDLQDGKEEMYKDDFEKVLEIITRDSDISVRLVEEGYLDNLVKAFSVKKNIIRPSILFAIACLAMSKSVKQQLFDMKLHIMSLSLLDESQCNTELALNSCKLLYIISSLGDEVKQTYLKFDCIISLFQIMNTHNNSDLMFWALNVIYSICEVNIMNRYLILKGDSPRKLLSILQKPDCLANENVALLIVSMCIELDWAAVKFQELGIQDVLVKTISDHNHCKGIPFMEENALSLLDSLFLFTVKASESTNLMVSPISSEDFVPSWPPNMKDVKLFNKPYIPETISTSRSVLWPQDEAYFKSNTPVAPELDGSACHQLSTLGLDPSKPIFRIGRFCGYTSHLCRNCEDDGSSSSKFISYVMLRPLGLKPWQYQHLIDNGWYRTGNVDLIRVCYYHNEACYNWETRVLARQFDPQERKSFKKVLRRMPEHRLKVVKSRTHFNREAYDLYSEYQVKKHGKPKESEYSYIEHVVNTPFSHEVIKGTEYGTFHVQYYLDNKLVAVSVIDVVPKGVVSIYMWYDLSKEVAKYSFGKYTILKEIEMVKSMGESNSEMEYYYLQGWHGGHKKLAYKADYKPVEFYCPCISTDWVRGLEGIRKAYNQLPGESPKESGAYSDETDQPPKKKIKLDVDTPPVNSSEVPDKDNYVETRKYLKSAAFPQDKKRHSNSLDINKLVICLNHSKYVYLADLKHYVNDDYQKKLVDARIKELAVALCPELCNQLVLDMIVC